MRFQEIFTSVREEIVYVCSLSRGVTFITEKILANDAWLESDEFSAMMHKLPPLLTLPFSEADKPSQSKQSKTETPHTIDDPENDALD